MEIRQIAGPVEAAQVVALLRGAWAAVVDPRSSGHTFGTDDLQLLLDEGATVLGAFDGSELLGTATIGASDDTGEPAEISKVATTPKLSRSGVGAAVMTEAHSTAAAMGHTSTLLAVSLYEPELVRWYARMQYVVSPTRVYRHASPNSPQPIVMERSERVELPDPVGEAAAALRSGLLVGMPTETVYGLAADASSAIAVRSVFAAKGRPGDHPLIVHLASRRSLDVWTVHCADAHRLAANYWPGPLTMVLPKQAHVLREITGGRDTVAVRVPSHPLALALIALVGPDAGLVAPSANPFGAVSPTTASHVTADDLADLVLDGGPCRIGVESTIVELHHGRPQVLRPGAVTAAQLTEALGREVDATPSGPSRAPGMLASHYAPAAGVRVIRSGSEVHETGPDVGYLGPLDAAPAGVVVLDAPNPYRDDAVAALLYARLREADDRELRVLYVVAPDTGPLAAAVKDRLARASHDPGR